MINKEKNLIKRFNSYSEAKVSRTAKTFSSLNPKNSTCSTTDKIEVLYAY